MVLLISRAGPLIPDQCLNTTMSDSAFTSGYIDVTYPFMLAICARQSTMFSRPILLKPVTVSASLFLMKSSIFSYMESYGETLQHISIK